MRLASHLVRAIACGALTSCASVATDARHTILPGQLALPLLEGTYIPDDNCDSVVGGMAFRTATAGCVAFSAPESAPNWLRLYSDAIVGLGWRPTYGSRQHQVFDRPIPSSDCSVELVVGIGGINPRDGEFTLSSRSGLVLSDFETGALKFSLNEAPVCGDARVLQ